MADIEVVVCTCKDNLVWAHPGEISECPQCERATLNTEARVIGNSEGMYLPVSEQDVTDFVQEVSA